MRTRRASILALLVATCFTTEALGQEGVPAPRAVPARNLCLDSIPASSLRLVPVYLTATLTDSSESYLALREGVDLFTQSVAQSVRTLLGAPDGVLPTGEPTIAWRSLQSGVLVVARRDGRISWELKPPTSPSGVRMDDNGADVVGRAVDSVRMRRGGLVFPASFAMDSISWLLQLESGVVHEAGEPSVPKMRMGFPVFSVLAPWERQVSVDRVRVRYPQDMRRAGFTGRILMQFLVDTAGHPVSSTFRDIFPAGQPPLTDRERFAYEQFIGAIRQALEVGRFRPASIGGCRMPQLVQQPFDFDLSDGRSRP